MAGPLRHLRVLDLSVFAQGGAAGAFFRELGAEVVKVERREGGDPGRRLTEVAPGASTFFEPFNREKQSITLDLQRPEGREILLRLAEGCDVLLHNARPGVMERLGLSYDDLRDLNPGLVYIAGSGYGTEGPDAGDGVVDIIGQARGGIASTTGRESPVPAGAIVADYVGAMHLVIGGLAALLQRAETGTGQRVDASMLGAMVSLQSWEFGHYLVTGDLPRRSGRGHQLFPSLWGIYETVDGAIALTGVAPERWEGFLNLIESVDLADDERFATAAARREHWDALADEVARRLRRLPADRLLEGLKDLGVRCTRVQDYAQLASDPQVIANEYIVEVEHPTFGRIRVPANPIRFSDADTETAVAAPSLGEHTDVILHSLGYSVAEIDDLRASHVI